MAYLSDSSIQAIANSDHDRYTLNCNSNNHSTVTLWIFLISCLDRYLHQGYPPSSVLPTSLFRAVHQFHHPCGSQCSRYSLPHPLLPSYFFGPYGTYTTDLQQTPSRWSFATVDYTRFGYVSGRASYPYLNCLLSTLREYRKGESTTWPRASAIL